MADQTGAVTAENGTEAPSPPRALDSNAAAGVAGVRFRDSGRVSYVDPGEIAVEIGDWVVVDTNRGHETGRVVIAPHQIHLNMLARNLKPIVRRLSLQDVAQMDRPERAGPGDDARLVGGLGRSAKRSDCLSHENERYQQMKAQLPRLGQRVDSPVGPGTVIALQVVKKLVTVRLEADNVAVTYAHEGEDDGALSGHPFPH